MGVINYLFLLWSFLFISLIGSNILSFFIDLFEAWPLYDAVPSFDFSVLSHYYDLIYFEYFYLPSGY